MFEIFSSTGLTIVMGVGCLAMTCGVAYYYLFANSGDGEK